MTLLYKLTDENGRTRNSAQWGEGVTHTASCEGELCGPGWLHAYTDPLLAVLLNSIHANFESPRFWEAEGEIGLSDAGLKVGCTSLTTLREIPVPEISLNARIAFAILCAKEVCDDSDWNKWAASWLEGSDRSAKSARSAAWAAAWAAAMAGWAATQFAAWAATQVVARTAARTAEDAAWTAALAAKRAGASLDLSALAKRAVEEYSE